MNKRTVNIEEKFSKFTEHWNPKIVAQMNDYHIKIARVKGDFVWHKHPNTDELFFVIEGQLQIDFKHGSVLLNEGELYVVQRGVEHKPFAQNECKILMFEPAGTVNTGETSNSQTTKPTWI